MEMLSFIILNLHDLSRDQITVIDCSIFIFIFPRPPMRQYMMDGDFFVGAALATTLTKLALKYINNTPDVKRQNVSPTCFLRKFL